MASRLIDDTWRFFRPAIEEWLASRDSRSILLQQAGALADDDTLPELLANIYKERGRPEYEEESQEQSPISNLQSPISNL